MSNDCRIILQAIYNKASSKFLYKSKTLPVILNNKFIKQTIILPPYSHFEFKEIRVKSTSEKLLMKSIIN